MRYLHERLEDLSLEVDKMERFTVAGKEAFFGDDGIQYSVMMAYARIGEIAKNIPNDLLATQPHVEWTQIKGFRDVLIHRYFEINIARVWEAVEKLPARCR